jgi:hypothetical protein
MTRQEKETYFLTNQTCNINKWNEIKKKHPVLPFPKCNRKITEKGKIDTRKTQHHSMSANFPGLVQTHQ